MTRIARFAPAVLLLLVAAASSGAQSQTHATIDQFLSAGFPSELVSAKRTDRVAWLGWERGKRNVYAAAAPAFAPQRLTKFLEDDGIELSNLTISDDGSTVAFIRGGAPNTVGWMANPRANPDGIERAIWVAKTNGTGAWRLSLGNTPALSPDGKWVVFARDSQIYRARVAPGGTTTMDRAETPFIRAWGRNANPKWSPDGTKLAFVSDRVDHSYIVVYDVKTRSLKYMAAGVDRDASPTWSRDGKQIAFIRRPGLPFGQQAHDGQGGLGDPPGPARGIVVAGGRGGRGGGGGDGAVQQGRSASPTARWRDTPGLLRATFPGGYTLSFWVADVATGEGREVWHNAPNDRVFPNVNGIEWAGESLIFQQEPEEWVRLYSVRAAGGTEKPVELTTGAGQVESAGYSVDGTTLFYSTNAGDIERRHVWRVPTSGGDAVQITPGDGIEMYPAPLASGRQVALLSATATRPMGVGIVPASGGSARIVYPQLTKDFPTDAHVVPTNVVLKADDGLEFHNQLFLPRDLKPGERRPAIVFVHGGPIRQMLLGYHYMDFYHMAYGVNEWLASQGYVVMSVNYRSGIGYGKSFRNAPNTGGRGNAEYKDLLAAGKYLQTRGDVDPRRIGIWGLSYGGVLTAQALARNSDIFVAGVDMAGVHLWGSSLDSTDVSYQSSAISAIDTWKSPVLVWAGDDDRNVQFSQTTGLVQLLRGHNVPFELMVMTDDTHETMLYSRWQETYTRMQDFLRRNVAEKKSSATSSQPHQ
jgi:dipeptidyl aminopeptidase/acylaminoacyl peptidase